MKAFTSYRHDPSSMLADLIQTGLKEFGIIAYVDTYGRKPEEARPGLIKDSLIQEIEMSDAFVCLLADSTLESNWVQLEIRHAYEVGKTLIPVFQESYVSPKEDTLADCVRHLIKSNGVTILDKKNIYIEEAIKRLAHLINPSLIVAGTDVGSLSRGKQIRIEITLDLPDIDLNQFILFVAAVTLVGVNAIQVVSRLLGSVILTLQMPEDAANRFLKLTEEKPHLFTEYRLVKAVKTQEHCLHIITGIRGGTGKTLLSLSAIGSYLLNNKKVLGIDLNHVNSDLFRLLVTSQPIDVLLPDWVGAEIGKTAYVARPATPFLLPEGAKGFWQNLGNLLDMARFKDHEVVVDTNLHVANIFGERLPDWQEISNIIRKSGRRVYVWVVWTRAGFQHDADFIRTALHNLQELASFIEFVHVLTPLATKTSTPGNLEEQIQQLHEFEAIRKKYDDLIRQRDEDDPGRQQLAEMRDTVLRNRLSELSLQESGVADLHLFADSPVVSKVDIDEFISVGQEIVTYDSSDFYDLALERFGGRPSNVLVISTQDPSLAGYVDRIEPGRDPFENLSSVRTEVSAFLENLE